MCSTPGCPLRYEKPLNNGQAYCRHHDGVKDSARAHEITRCLHELKPVFRQITVLNRLNAAQLLGRESVPVIKSLPADCHQHDGESFDHWKRRLSDYVDRYVTSGGINGGVPGGQSGAAAACR